MIKKCMERSHVDLLVTKESHFSGAAWAQGLPGAWLLTPLLDSCSFQGAQWGLCVEFVAAIKSGR